MSLPRFSPPGGGGTLRFADGNARVQGSMHAAGFRGASELAPEFARDIAR